MSNLVALYPELGRYVQRTYLPLLGLQLLALVFSLLPNSLSSGPLQGIATALVPLVTDPIITATSLAFAHGILTGQTTMGAAFVAGVRTWPLLVMTSALTVLCAMVPTGWLFALAYGRFAQAVNGGEDFLMVALPFAAMLALAVPGIYIGVRLFATVPILFVEHHTPFSAIRRSWNLLKGQWWPTALAFVPLGAISLILGAVLSPILASSPLAELLLPSRPAWSGGIVALRLVGPLGWTLYMLCCLRLLKQDD